MPTCMSPQRQFRKNTTTVALATFNYVVVFDTPLADTDYEVYFQASLNTGIGVASKTTTGYTMVLALSVAGSVISYAVSNHL